MELGTAPLFDLPAPLGGVVVEPVVPEAERVVVTRSQELLAEISDHRAVVAEREIATVRAIA